MLNRFGRICCLLSVFTILASWDCGPKQYPEGMYAEIDTTKGLIVIKLEFDKTPLTVTNFCGLAEGTIENSVFPLGTSFYEGSKFHRVVPGHVIQAGAPNTEKETGCGYTIPNEIHPALSHSQPGMVGMANSGPHTNGSQFYITLGDRSYLDGDYPLFGRVFSGMEIVKNIQIGDEIISINIIRMGKKAKKFKCDHKTFTALLQTAKEKQIQDEQEKIFKENETIQNSWPEAISTNSGLKYVILEEGEGDTPQEGDLIQVLYSGNTLEGKKFISTAEDGKPDYGTEPRVFTFELGRSSLNPGFDEAITNMKKGEKRILILLAALAYGIQGYYAPEKQGEKRFFLSPNSTLVYEITLIDIITD
ncbi:MAG: peptidylprolyl isomerase [Candidatus Aminicenantes bacterium]|nr:peptidylprolyl isomerase [Candidatus Aminicenantes bacterium]